LEAIKKELDRVREEKEELEKRNLNKQMTLRKAKLEQSIK
jgi:hypothetical protein